MIGRVFTRLTVVERAGRDKKRNLLWRCKCSCGRKTVTAGYRLRNGETRSCGCLQRESVTKRNLSHGQSGSRLYNIWANMKERCENENCPQFSDYGGRGIKVCSAWADSFQEFANWALNNGYAENLSIDRVDNDAGYSPENCRWATAFQQSRNKRPRKDQKLSDFDVERIRSDRRYQRVIAADYNVSQSHVSRIKRGAQRAFPTETQTIRT